MPQKILDIGLANNYRAFSDEGSANQMAKNSTSPALITTALSVMNCPLSDSKKQDQRCANNHCAFDVSDPHVAFHGQGA